MHRSTKDKRQSALAAELLRRVLHDAAASGRRRRSADASTTGIVTELIEREWIDWDDERLVLTDVGRRGLSVLQRGPRRAP